LNSWNIMSMVNASRAAKGLWQGLHWR